MITTFHQQSFPRFDKTLYIFLHNSGSVLSFELEIRFGMKRCLLNKHILDILYFLNGA